MPKLLYDYGEIVNYAKVVNELRERIPSLKGLSGL